MWLAFCATFQLVLYLPLCSSSCLGCRVTFSIHAMCVFLVSLVILLLSFPCFLQSSFNSALSSSFFGSFCHAAHTKTVAIGHFPITLQALEVRDAFSRCCELKPFFSPCQSFHFRHREIEKTRVLQHHIYCRFKVAKRQESWLALQSARRQPLGGEADPPRIFQKKTHFFTTMCILFCQIS